MKKKKANPPSQSDFKDVLQAAKMGVFNWDILENVLFWDDRNYAVFGVDPEDFSGAYEAWASCLDPEQREIAEMDLKRALDGECDFNTQFRIRKPNGERAYIRGAGAITRDAEGRPIRMVGLNWDVTHEVKLGEEVKENRDFVQGILDAIPDPIFVKDIDHRWIYGNQRFDALLAKEKSEYIGKSDFDLFPKEQASVFWKKDDEVMKSNQPSENEELIRAPDGSNRIALTQKTPHRLADGTKILIGVIRDITESRRLELDLETSQAKQQEAARMASLGEMAGGIAHEINNPLAVIMGKASQVSGLLDLKGESVSEDLAQRMSRVITASKKIEHYADRIATIVRGLRNFSRDGRQDPMSETLISSVIEDALALCQERFKSHGVELNLNQPSEKIFVQARPSQLAQIVLNLLSNAFDATVDLEHPQVWIEVQKRENRVRLLVRDSGPGIPPEIEEKIMRPFFTTKSVGKGTGLGLSISHGLAKDHGGDLSLDRSISGSCFCLELPLFKVTSF
jgi:PAS domain S-box-containing protein